MYREGQVATREKQKAGDVAQVGEHLPSKQKALRQTDWVGGYFNHQDESGLD
jgi:hypothetical protein